MKAQALLPTASEVQSALGVDVPVESSDGGAPASAGNVIKAAASDSAFRRYATHLSDESGDSPVAASIMALIFDSSDRAAQTFSRVAEAAHLRTELDGSNVAVETVTSAGGLVSYWGYVQKREALVVVTLDTLDPQRVSVGNLRSLAKITAERLETAIGQN